jgi:two-component system chemotaxis response regulator CheY
MGHDRRLGALIVEDNEVSRALLRGLLRSRGIEVQAEARTAEQARKLLKRAKPDLVCLDIVLPDGDGIALLHEIRAAQPQAKIVMVSAASEQAHVEGARARGADGFVVKPYCPATLLAALERLFPRSPKAAR